MKIPIFLSVLLPAVAFSQCAESDRGWWVKICPGTGAEVKVTLGIGGNEDTREFWRTISPDDRTVIPVPAKYLHAGRIFIHADAVGDKPVDMCLGFNADAVQKMTFEGDGQHEKSRDDRDDRGCGC